MTRRAAPKRSIGASGLRVLVALTALVAFVSALVSPVYAYDSAGALALARHAAGEALTNRTLTAAPRSPSTEPLRNPRRPQSHRRSSGRSRSGRDRQGG